MQIFEDLCGLILALDTTRYSGVAQMSTILTHVLIFSQLIYQEGLYVLCYVTMFKDLIKNEY